MLASLFLEEEEEEEDEEEEEEEELEDPVSREPEPVFEELPEELLGGAEQV